MSEQRIKSEYISREQYGDAVLNSSRINVHFLREDIYQYLLHRGIVTSVFFKRGVKDKYPFMEIYLSRNKCEKIVIFP